MIIRKVKTTNDVKQLFLESNGEICFGVTKSKKLYVIQGDEIVEISPHQAAREFQLDVNEIYEKIELALNEDLVPIEEQDIKTFSESQDEHENESKTEDETHQNVSEVKEDTEPNKDEKIEITENSEIDNDTFSVEKLDSEKLVESIDKIIKDLKLVIDSLEALK